MPEEFPEERRILPLIASALEKIFNSTKSGQVSEGTCKGLWPVLESCQSKIEELSAIFKNVLLAEGASKWIEAERRCPAWAKIKGSRLNCEELGRCAGFDLLSRVGGSYCSTVDEFHDGNVRHDGFPAFQKASIYGSLSKGRRFLFGGGVEIMQEIEDRFKTVNGVQSQESASLGMFFY